MSEAAAVVAESQPAVEVPAMDVSRGPLVDITAEQRAEFRKTGELPKPKTEEAAASSEPKPEEGEAKPAGDSEPPKKTQENTDRKSKAKTAEDRIAELEATIEKIRKGAGKETPKVESSPTKPEPKPAQQSPEKEPTPEDQNADGTPKFKTYEEFTKALARYEARQERAEWQQRQAEQEMVARSRSKVEEAKSRYGNFDEAVGPFVDAIVNDADVSPIVKQMIDDSDIFADLAYTIGSNKEDLAAFSKMAKENPGKAIRYIALTESLIADELGKKTESSKTEEPPVKPKTQAPKPPSEAGGRAAAPPDSLEAAAKANDFRSFKAEANRRAIAKLKS